MPLVQQWSWLVALSHLQDASCFSVGGQSRLPPTRALGFDTGDADASDAFKEVKWTRESTVGGPPKWECGEIIEEKDLIWCSETHVSTFRGYTHILTDTSLDLSTVAGNVYLLANNASRGLRPCVMGSNAFQGTGQSVHSPLRVIVDAQYVNMPRCCHGSEVEGLVLNDAGEYYPWTQDAVTQLENVTFAGMKFYRLRPQAVSCTEALPCPLVIQIPGAGGNPWLLIQGHCQSCKQQLGVVMIQPFLERDMYMPGGIEAGSSNDVLTASLIPFLVAYIPVDRQINPQRVYVVAQSQGDDTALRLALLRPDLINLVSLSGKNAISTQTMQMLSSPDFSIRIQSSRLKYIQWNIGDLDTVFEDTDYYSQFARQIRQFAPGPFPVLDLRIYPQSFHSVWWAAWNALHEIIWTGQRSALRITSGITTTCPGAGS